MKQLRPKAKPTSPKVVPLPPRTPAAPVVPRAQVEGRHHYFTNTNGRRWGR